MNYNLEDVFGISSKQVSTYIERPDVDDRFLEAIKSDKQIVVYGASKQGKTALVSKHIPYNDNIVISLTPSTELIDIHHSILRQLNIQIEETQNSSIESSLGGGANVRFTAKIPLIGSAGVESSASGEQQESNSQSYRSVPFNLELPQDISELIRSVRPNARVILENFHYLEEETQRIFSFNLRAFQELNVQFIILGIWREKNRLIQFNGDLLDRVTEVPVEPWEDEEFRKIAQRGSEHLNIEFTPQLLNKTIEASMASVGVFQELMKSLCLSADVNKTQKELFKISLKTTSLNNVLKQKGEGYASRHQRALEAIASGNRSSSLHLPYYLVKIVLNEGYDGMEQGLSRTDIHSKIQSIHHNPADGIRASDISNLLHNLARLQHSKQITPPIIDYDQQKKSLQVVDSTFYFFLRHSNLKKISEEISSPPM